MNYFEAHLMVSRVVDSNVLRMVIQFEYFFRRFLLFMSPEVLAFKVHILPIDFKFELE